jgi:hypothetical protein
VKHVAFTKEALVALRQEFDTAFQSLPQQADSGLANYLLLQVAGIRYAVALRQVAALQSQSRITRLPSMHPALLGVCGARSELLAVYDLGVCLGHARCEHHPWLVRVAGTTLAFAFEHLERHARAPAASHDTATARVVTLDDVGTLPLLDLHHLARGVVGSSPRPSDSTSKER